MGKWEAFFAFHFPMPVGSFGLPCCRRWRFRAQRRMRPFGVVVDTPAFRQHPHLFEGIEDFTFQELVTHFAVERFAVAVLPGRAGFDVKGSSTGLRQPFAQLFGDELRALYERMYCGMPCSIMASARTSITWLLLILRPT